jgi:hypothetical protein
MNVETKAERAAARWQDQVYDLLRRNNVTQFAYVPDGASHFDRPLLGGSSSSFRGLDDRGGGGGVAGRG